MKKFLTVLFSLILFFSVFSVVSAQNLESQSDSGDVPEKNGDYPDPNNKKVRVRVFVHAPKNKLTPNPVATCDDIDSTAIVAATGWHLPGNVTYRLNALSVPSSVGSSNLASISANAFSVWKDAVPEKVNFTRGSNTSVNKSRYDGQNIVAWGRTSASALAVTYTRYYTSGGLVVDVDTIFNKSYIWSWTNPASNSCSLYSNAYDAQDILTHELGHWMGLDDHYTLDYVNNTMYGYGSKGEIKKNTLTTGDKTNLSTIYP
ncbi:MAG: matrixin family metalloprotease [Candidatus Levybacteria bacterium]|nr:matrixin family metalloprotease [Candidatus Levybacteria bacterium]